MNARLWVRGWTPLGLLNTLLAGLFGVVLVRVVDDFSLRTVRWQIEPAANWPRPRC